MPAPTYQASTIGVGTNSISVNWPAGHLADDIALLVIETGGEGATLTPPSDWTAITSTPVTDIADATGSKLHCWWRRATSNAEASVSTGDSGDHQIAMMTTYRGCATTGNPFDVTTTGSKTTASTTSTVPAVTTTVSRTLIVGIIGRPNYSLSTTEFSGYTNANLTSITERREFGGVSGHGGGMVVFTGIKSTAGNTGTTSVTKVTSTTDTYIVVALRPPPLILTADVGSFNDTFVAANLLRNARLVADKGAYALTGNAATLSKGTTANAYTLTADKGTFTLAGNAATIDKTSARAITALPGKFALTGQLTALRSTHLLAANAGAATVTGADATLLRTVRLAAAPGACIVSGQSAGFQGQRYLPLAPGAFALTGQAADLRFNRRLQGGSATFLATGLPANLTPTFSRRRVIIF